MASLREALASARMLLDHPGKGLIWDMVDAGWGYVLASQRHSQFQIVIAIFTLLPTLQQHTPHKQNTSIW
jgi:hypothetical protein